MGIENEILIPMNADHSSICKFESPDDHHYKQLRGVIHELVKKGLDTSDKRPQTSVAAAAAQGRYCPLSMQDCQLIPITNRSLNPFVAFRSVRHARESLWASDH